MPSSPRFKELVASIRPHVREVSPSEALARQTAGALLIDVREAEEYAKEHAREAIHLSRGVLEMKIEDAAPDLNASIICYCGGGNRSILAVENLQRMGYANVVSMRGGFKEWKEQHLPLS
jgi:rhodanese-related sulfurtransferase